MPFPVGMSTIKVVGHLDDPNGKPAAGYVRVIAQRQLGFGGTPWIMQATGKWVPLKLGDFTLEVPHSAQFGLTGDNGVPLTDPVSYRFELRPTNSGLIQTIKWVQLPSSLGSSVPLAVLADLGGWPAVSAPAPITPASPTTTGVYTETPPGSGIFRWSAS